MQDLDNPERRVILLKANSIFAKFLPKSSATSFWRRKVEKAGQEQEKGSVFGTQALNPY